MQNALWIFLGGGLGSLARWDVSTSLTQHLGFPWGILVVNLTGCFIIGAFATATGPEGRWLLSPSFREFFMLGVCGGYTTFSSFSLDTLQLAEGGEFLKAGENAVLSLVLCLVGVWLGHVVAEKINSMKGGKHADNSVDFQEYMAMPVGAPSFAEALRYGAETFHALKGILHRRKLATSVGDEGGFAPNLESNEQAVEVILEAIAAAGLRPGKDVAIALDPASSSFFEGGVYNLAKSGQGKKSSEEMIALYAAWVKKYPIVSIEDGLAENDWAGFAKQTAAMGGEVQIVGDDLYVTNTKFIARGIKEKASNAVLIKLNQIGTVTETIESIQMCQRAGWRYVISHRSGETEDSFMADFAVAMGGGQIKTGSACRSERIAKYNRLLAIEAELDGRAVCGGKLLRAGGA